jgi:hypothetical protein
MRNLKKETIDLLNNYGYTINDIKWIGTVNFKIPIELFWKLADIDYDNDFGHPEVAMDLMIVGDDWWLERKEYDGNEWWEFCQKPNEPKDIEKVHCLTMSGLDEPCFIMDLKDAIINKEDVHGIEIDK